MLICLSIGITLGILEAGFRLTRYLVRGPDSILTVEDGELGWVHNVRRGEDPHTNSCGEEVLTLPAVSPLLVRSPKKPDGRRVLFLGDSTTHAYEVSTGAAYYDIVETLGEGQYSVWAAGVGGYSNLQEYLLLMKIYDDIQPEIIVWQLDSNDVADNVYELDRASLSSPMRTRPYLNPSSGQVTLRNPGLLPFRVSHGARFLFSHLAGVDIRFELGIIPSIERWLRPAEGQRPILEQRGLDVLDQMVRETRRRFPRSRVIGLALMADLAEEDSLYEEIFRRHGADYWSRFDSQVRMATSDSTDCRPWDRHWNHAGNRIAGRLIAEGLREE
ncbi:MAG TPA: hypothetical protein VJL88_06740 [Nitrospira sp.]|nr:hypothetical protein [Nitrospira sp.]